MGEFTCSIGKIYDNCNLKEPQEYLLYLLNIYGENFFLTMFLPTYDHHYPPDLRRKMIKDTLDNALNSIREPQQNKYPSSTRRLCCGRV